MSGVDDAGKMDRRDLKNTKGYRRIFALLDKGSFNEIDAFAKSGNDYAEAAAGYGKVDGFPVYVFCQNPDVGKGAMSKAQASKIRKVYALAVRTGAPVIGIYDSAGARLGEGPQVMEDYGELLLDMNNLSGVVPQISLVLGPCTGTSALIAAGADLVVMSDRGELTVGTNGEGGSPEEAAKLGLCHIAAKDEAEAFGAVKKLVDLLPSNNLTASPVFDAGREPVWKGGDFRQVISSVCDEGSFLELGKKFGASCVTGLASVGGTVSGISALGGVIDPDACSKAARFVRFCDSFSIPVVTLVDAEKFATLREASKLSAAYSEATTAKIAVVTGSACGAVYIAVAGRGANADYAMAWPGAAVSALAPETAAIFLWNDRLKGSASPEEDRKKLIEEYRRTEASPYRAAESGMIEDVVEPEDTRAKILVCLDMLEGKRTSTLPKKHADIQL